MNMGEIVESNGNVKYYYYFISNSRMYKSETEVNLELNKNFIEMTDEQATFWDENPSATIYEVMRCELDTPYMPPTPSLSELKEIAIDEIDRESRSVIGSFVDVLTFSNTVASTVYAKAKGITPIYDDEKVLKIATNFLVNGKLCKDLYNETVSLIESAHTKEEIDEMVENAKDQYNHIRNSEDSIEKHRMEKLQEIELYDTSEHVNSFTFNGQKMWLDKNTRMSLMNTLQLCEATGKETMDIWFGDISYNLDIDTAKAILTAIEMYAMDCYNVTATHKAAVKNLQTIEEIDSFDVTADYRSNPVF